MTETLLGFAKPMTANEIEDVLTEYKEKDLFAPLILVPCVHGVPYNGYFLMPHEIQKGSIECFLSDLNIMRDDNPALKYYLVRVYKAEYKETRVMSLQTV